MELIKKAVVMLTLSCSYLFAPFKEIGSERELNSELKNQQYSIVSFHSPECPKCKIFMPAYRNLGPKTDIMLYGVNIDELKGLRNEYRVISTPTVYLIDSKNGTREPVKWGSENVKTAIEKIHTLQKKQLSKNLQQKPRRLAYRGKTKIRI